MEQEPQGRQPLRPCVLARRRAHRIAFSEGQVMPRRRSLLAWPAAAVLASAASFAGAKPPPATRIARFVSARWLQQALLAVPAARLPADVPELRMAGMTRLDGFQVDADGGDVVFFGSFDAADGPVLHTADLVVALRSATHRYLDRQRRFSPPGMSLDPQPSTVKRLMRFDGRGLYAQGAAAKAAAQAWTVICSEAQDVRVIGLPLEGNHYLATITSCDAEMKSYVDGTHELAGLHVPSRVAIERFEAELRAGRKPQVSQGHSMSRYWFNAGANRIGVHADGTHLLLTCEVRLSTESQMLAAGRLADSGRRDEEADRCAESFTRLLPALAGADARYAQLINIYRAQSLAIAVVHSKATQRARLSLDPLLDGWQVPIHPVPKQLPGRAAIKGAEFRIEQENGFAIYKLRIPSCGGVIVAPASTFSRTSDRHWREAMHAALMPRTRGGRGWWDAPLPGVWPGA